MRGCTRLGMLKCLVGACAMLLLCGAVLAQPPMNQAPPGPNGAQASQPTSPDEGEAQPPTGPAVRPGTLDPATGASAATVPNAPESAPAPESTAVVPAPKMAHTGLNLVSLYAVSAGALLAGLLLWKLSRRQLRTLA